MTLLQLPLASIDSNPYNSRKNYDTSVVDRLAHSLSSNGQLSVIKVRPSPTRRGKYELVFGHRRVMAAKKLGWKSIRAEVVSRSEQEMILESLVENVEHEDLSDYEKALTFERMSKEFGKTYEEIGRTVGISKQHVSNYISMLRLFSPSFLSSNPKLRDVLQKISEHHARVLSRIDDENARADLAFMALREQLSVKELTNMTGRLRSWFGIEHMRSESENGKDRVEPNDTSFADENSKADQDEIGKITKIILDEFRLPHKGDFSSYRNMHLYEEGFSIYTAFPPFGRFEGSEALVKERKWFHEIAPDLSTKVRDLKIEILGEVALATLSVMYSGKYFHNLRKMAIRGTIVLCKREVSWKILHEHWSRQDATAEHASLQDWLSTDYIPRPIRVEH